MTGYPRADKHGHVTVTGECGVRYNADTVEQIDANLASIRRDSPDIDVLLDARRIVSVLNAFTTPPDAEE